MQAKAEEARPITDKESFTLPQLAAHNWVCSSLDEDHLEDAIQGVEGKAGKGRQRVLLVVLVVSVVQQPAQRSTADM